MNPPEKRHPSLTPSFPLSAAQTSRVMANTESPQPHHGWYSRGYLPHWDHPGMIQSVNFRLGDSMPASVIEKWKIELALQPESQRAVELRRRIEEYLDAGHGRCWLHQPDVACLVERALFHFDEQRYRLLAWCIMPNHVHALIETQEGFPLADVLHSWKSFTSHKASEILRRNGEFWQREYLDRYVRNAEHYEKVVAYIEENPVKAGLARIKTDWSWSSARFRIPGSAGVPPASW
jgi:REP element-mobilizing transposase RayT